jgi:formylglycine-generating enzyme required for sulfatase activity
MRLGRVGLWLFGSAAALLLASSASSVTIDWVAVGDPGNACDPQSLDCFGSVAYPYLISKYEVTNVQYAEFLNAKAASDPLDLYSTSMAASTITRSGSPGSYTYAAVVGREDMPANFVSFYDSLRFVNWMHNGQGSGDTETGAYTLLGGTPTPSNGSTITRNPGATIVLTNEDEWYKAAYYDVSSSSYLDYPAGTDTPIVCAAPGATANTANCGGVVGDLTAVGSYTGSASPNGTFDQGGNASEWHEELYQPLLYRGLRGGASPNAPSLLSAASSGGQSNPAAESFHFGFRVASPLPEPAAGLLILTGAALGGLRGRRRAGRPRAS